MKNIYFLLLIIAAGLWACGSGEATAGAAAKTEGAVDSATSVDSMSENPQPEENTSPEEEMAPTPETVPLPEPQVEKEDSEVESAKRLSGTFKSKRGVMDRLSCFCYNCGYLTLESGERVPVCFEDDDIKVNCEKVTLKGVYREKMAATDGSCASGSMRVFLANSFQCD